MKVREVIEKLSKYNPEAEVKVIDESYTGHRIVYYGFGSSEGCTMENCENVCFIFREVEDNTEK